MGKGKGSPRIEEKENSSSGDSHKTHEIWFKERGFFFAVQVFEKKMVCPPDKTSCLPNASFPFPNIKHLLMFLRFTQPLKHLF